MIPVVAEHYRTLAEDLSVMRPFAMDGKEETLIRVMEESGIMNLPHVSAMVRDTISLTMMAAGVKTNVIPDHATAELDIRLLPGQTVERMIEILREAFADGEIEIDRSRAMEASESPIDNPYYGIIRDVMRESYPESIVAPVMMTGTSDSRFFREKGIPSYGVFPILIPIDNLGMVHGIDEKISLENIDRGVEVLVALVRRLCAVG